MHKCTHTHLPNRCQFLQTNAQDLSFPFHILFYFLHFTLWMLAGVRSERFFVLIHFKCFIECCVRYTYLFLSHSLSLSFRFGARSTGSRRGEKRLIFQYVILYFPVNKCVCVCLCVCVSETHRCSGLNFPYSFCVSW